MFVGIFFSLSRVTSYCGDVKNDCGSYFISLIQIPVNLCQELLLHCTVCNFIPTKKSLFLRSKILSCLLLRFRIDLIKNFLHDQTLKSTKKWSYKYIINVLQWLSQSVFEKASSHQPKNIKKLKNILHEGTDQDTSVKISDLNRHYTKMLSAPELALALFSRGGEKCFPIILGHFIA